MKRLLINISLFFCLLSLTQSCQKTTQGSFVPIVGFDTTWNSTDTFPQLTSSIETPPVTDSFNCNDNNGAQVSIGDSVEIIFPAGGCLTTPNNPSSRINTNAKVKIELTTLTSKADFIKHRISSTSKGNLLQFGAYLDLKLSYKGDTIYWDSTLSKQIKVAVRTSGSNPLQSPQFYTFQYDTTAKDTSWVAVNLPVIPTHVGVTGGGLYNQNGYLFYTNIVGKFGCGNLLPGSSATTRVNVILPVNFTNKNTIVFAVFNNSNTVVRLKSNPQGKSFDVTSIPTPSDITLLSISKLGNDYYLGTDRVIAIDSSPFSFTPTKLDLSSIDKFLRSL
jgi:hypothetical protein